MWLSGCSSRGICASSPTARTDPSADHIGDIIAGRATGNPFFAEEITRDLAERGVLVGERGNYGCHTDVSEVSVPATLQATIAARIDRLGSAAKHALVAAAVSDVFARHSHNLGDRPLVNVYVAREGARRGDHDDALQLMRASIDRLVREGQLLAWGIPATGVVVETLLELGTESEVAEAEAAIERLAGAPTEQRSVVRDVLLLRLRALLARAHGDAASYAHFRDCYRDMARTLGFEGHIAWAEATP